jgi:hypothetical protein
MNEPPNGNREGFRSSSFDPSAGSRGAEPIDGFAPSTSTGESSGSPTLIVSELLSALAREAICGSSDISLPPAVRFSASYPTRTAAVPDGAGVAPWNGGEDDVGALKKKDSGKVPGLATAATRQP